jgi:hypothetical protein
VQTCLARELARRVVEEDLAPQPLGEVLVAEAAAHTLDVQLGERAQREAAAERA